MPPRATACSAAAPADCPFSAPFTVQCLASMPVTISDQVACASCPGRPRCGWLLHPVPWPRLNQPSPLAGLVNRQLYSSTTPQVSFGFCSTFSLLLLLLALRVHAEFRPPDTEASSKFPGTFAGHHGICQGRNVHSPPARHATSQTFPANTTAVLLTSSSLAQARRVWELPNV